MDGDYLHTIGNSSFGGIQISQYRIDLDLWETVLNAHPETTAICELGTWKGGFSWWLWAQAQARGMRFATFDAIDMESGVPGFERLDVFLDKQKVLDWITGTRGWFSTEPQIPLNDPIVLFCDNGNKPRELREYTPHLPAGSITLVHDWGTETMPEDVPDWLEMIHGDLCEQIGSITRVFKRKGE
jgi:hypothetical protein